ncbi:MAG: iron-siderophore ABC transporter substrate-binding protein [Actinomycetota bacterium]|nr:iron-siderophore ABC transporter substrate-binding protein [Actinomycetota bacterium]
MRAHAFRRGTALAAAALVALAATACGSDTASQGVGSAEQATTGEAFPATIEHAYGTTTIDRAPARVVSVGYSDQDPMLALGVTPVAVREWFGEQPDATWPWAQDELGAADPEVLDVAELNFERIAGLRPDVIVGVSSGMTDDEYKRLSLIAPTIARPKEHPDYGVPWQEQTRVIGRALGKQAGADELVARIEARFATARQEHQAFEKAKVIVVRPSTEPGQFFVFGPDDSRSRFMTALGFSIPDEVATLAGDSFTATISAEQLELLNTADVVVWNVDSPADRAAVETNPIYGQLEIRRAGRDLFLDEQTNAALSFSSVLSLPAALDTLVPQLAEKVASR